MVGCKGGTRAVESRTSAKTDPKPIGAVEKLSFKLFLICCWFLLGFYICLLYCLRFCMFQIGIYDIVNLLCSTMFLELFVDILWSFFGFFSFVLQCFAFQVFSVAHRIISCNETLHARIQALLV